MSASVNKCIFIGNLGRDPEVRNTQNGSKIVNLNLAVSESWKDKSTGERKEKTEWVKVVIFNENLADIAEKYLRTGSKVYIEGQLQTRKWTNKDGHEQYSTEVVLSAYRGTIVLLDGRAPTQGERQEEKSGGAPKWEAPADLDDEIPF